MWVERKNPLRWAPRAVYFTGGSKSIPEHCENAQPISAEVAQRAYDFLQKEGLRLNGYGAASADATLFKGGAVTDSTANGEACFILHHPTRKGLEDMAQSLKFPAPKLEKS
jgi:hypothetical protein